MSAYHLLDDKPDVPIMSVGVPAKETTRKMQVIAPSALPKNYVLFIEVDGKGYSVLVPKDVKEGEQFSVTIDMLKSETDTTAPPVGEWKDGICGWAKQGICHPLTCFVCWFRPLALAKVMTTLNLNWLGQPADPRQDGDSKSVFKKVAAIFGAYVLIDCILQATSTGILFNLPKPDEVTTVPYGLIAAWWIVYYLQVVVNLFFWFYMLMVLVNTRRALRRRDGIPEKNCQGCEDCCVAIWCDCCSVAQMLRHTANEDTCCCNEECTEHDIHVSIV